MPRGSTELMADGVLVLLLLVFIWAAVLVPPAAGARASREADFLGSIRSGSDPLEGNLGRRQPDAAPDQPRFRPALTANARRRQVLGGLMVAMAATLLLGLLPTFRLLLVVHLFLVNSCLAYVGLLVHTRDQQAARGRAADARVQARPVLTAVEAGYTDLVDDEFAASGAGYAIDEEPTFADAYYGADDDDRYQAYAGYATYGLEQDDEADDEAEAAYVDELGLELAQPA